MVKKNNLGIVLCGGGVRGLTQIGILACLEDHGISPTHIAGSSIGAVIGAFYAAGYTPKEMLEVSRQSSLLKVFRLGFNHGGLSNLKYLLKILKKNIKEDSFEALGKRLFVCVSNLNTGKYEIRDKGEMFSYILASAAVPIVFEAQKINGQVYVDGGLLNNFPIEPLKEHCKKTIGVFVHNYRELPVEKMKTWQDIADRCLSLHLYQNSGDNLNACDVVIEPEKSYEYGVFKKKTDEKLFKIGYEKTESMIEDIKKAIS